MKMHEKTEKRIGPIGWIGLIGAIGIGAVFGAILRAPKTAPWPLAPQPALAAAKTLAPTRVGSPR